MSGKDYSCGKCGTKTARGAKRCEEGGRLGERATYRCGKCGERVGVLALGSVLRSN